MSLIDDVTSYVEAVEDAAAQFARVLGILRDTAGPGPDQHPPVAALPNTGQWSGGLWTRAHYIPANPGRVGPSIHPCVVVDHTTDMVPEDWDALKRAWVEQASDGACAHFLVGRTPAQGVIQFVPVNRNGNHAGGRGHGVFMPGSIHPNLISVGIEFHCAGGVQRVGGAWRFAEGGKLHGAPLPDDEVEPDPIRPGRGWHKLTPYQEQIRAQLHDELEQVLGQMPAGLVAKSTGEAVPKWAVPVSARRVGHVSLDPTNRSDPWPPGMRSLAE